MLLSLIVLFSSRSEPVILIPGVKKDGAGRSGMLEVEGWCQIVCGYYYTVGITPKGDLYAWGQGDCGQLGHDATNDVDKPKLVTSSSLIGKEVVHVSCGEDHTAIVTSEGELYTWYDSKKPYSPYMPLNNY